MRVLLPVLLAGVVGCAGTGKRGGDGIEIEKLMRKPNAAYRDALVRDLTTTRTALVDAVLRADRKGVEAQAKSSDPADRNDALLVAALRQNTEAVDVLLANGADPNVADARGVSPLLVAAALGDVTTATSLVGRGANVNGADVDGRTPLMLASSSPVRVDPRFIALLLENNASAAKRDRAGRTALMYAAWGGDPEAVGQIVRADLESVGAACVKGYTPLMYATSEAAVAFLLGEGAAVDADTHEGRTALWLAVYRGNAGVVEALIKEGANRRIKVQANAAFPGIPDGLDAIGLAELRVEVLRKRTEAATTAAEKQRFAKALEKARGILKQLKK